MSETTTLYRSDHRPVFEPFTIQPPAVTGFQFQGDLASELEADALRPGRPSTCSMTCWPSASWRR